MIYATLREALYDFFTHNAPLVSDGDYYSSEDVFTALPYAKGRRYFDAVALPGGQVTCICRDYSLFLCRYD